MGVGLGGSFFYTPPSNPLTDMGNSPWGRSMLEQSPQTAFYRLGQQIGVPDDQSGFGRWFRQQFPNFNLGYSAYTVSNPLTANIVDYANSLGGFNDWYREYLKQAPQLRGLDPSARGAGEVRWIGR